jgi:hypothetical protein
MSYRWSSTAAAAYLDVFLRGAGGWQGAYRPKDGYGLQLASNTGTVTVQKTVAGAVTNLQSVAAAQHVTTAKQWLRLRVTGATVEFKTWLDGSAEPTQWAGVATDTAVTGPGQLFVSLVRAASNVGVKTVTLDDLKILDS